jgi:hypothetical protein
MATIYRLLHLNLSCIHVINTVKASQGYALRVQYCSPHALHAAWWNSMRHVLLRRLASGSCIIGGS